jgi:hypothetical protein
VENGVLILHNAQPHVGKDVHELLLPRPPYSANMSPPDIDLFPKLKINMHGARISTLEDLSAPIPDASDSCSRELTGTMYLTKRWDAVIRKKGDYTEGL